MQTRTLLVLDKTDDGKLFSAPLPGYHDGDVFEVVFIDAAEVRGDASIEEVTFVNVEDSAADKRIEEMLVIDSNHVRHATNEMTFVDITNDERFMVDANGASFK